MGEALHDLWLWVDQHLTAENPRFFFHRTWRAPGRGVSWSGKEKAKRGGAGRHTGKDGTGQTERKKSVSVLTCSKAKTKAGRDETLNEREYTRGTHSVNEEKRNKGLTRWCGNVDEGSHFNNEMDDGEGS